MKTRTGLWVTKPDVAITLLVWAAVLLMTMARIPLLAYPISFSTLAYLTLHAGVLVLGLSVVPTQRASAYSYSSSTIPGVVCLGMSCLVLISGLAFIASTGRGLTLNFAAARAEHSAVGVAPGIYSQIYLLLSPLAYIVTYLVTLNAYRLATKISSLLIMGSGLLFETVATGGRAVIISVGLFGCICLGLKHRHKLIANYRRTISLLLAATMLFLAINSAFSMLRFRELGYNLTIENGLSEASDLVRALGIKQEAPRPILSLIWQTLEYTSNPIVYFDMFESQFSDTPLGGLHSLPTIGNRVGSFSWPEHKKMIDELYEVYGITWNVWATMVRSLVIDFGYIWSVPTTGIIGLFIGFARRYRDFNFGFGCLYIFGIQWCIFTPFYSLTLLRPFELGIYYSVFFAALQSFMVSKVKNRSKPEIREGVDVATIA
jgi:hypothetical protein